jgi:uncharacterized protein (UPF0212 family)
MELADIFRAYAPAYIKEHPLPKRIMKVINAIVQCRTAALGGHVERCEACGYERTFYNSCRNRHCPKCGSLAKERWLISRKKDVLPITYFHVVFTIPDLLNHLTLLNQRILYTLLFRSGTETLLTLGRDKQHLGARIGILATLHTWGQNLTDHPHLHCIVTGGGLSEDKKTWKYPKKLQNRKAFFVHVNVLSDLFKKKFIAYLQEAYEEGKLTRKDTTSYFKTKGAFIRFKNDLYKKSWVTFCKEPFSGADKVLEYLGRYVYRVAITNRRLLKLEDRRVIFTWRDYRDGKEKIMSLEVFEFIRRFLLHVLPEGFSRIRYYGILASRNLSTKLKQCKELLKVRLNTAIEKLTWKELFFHLTGIDLLRCPECGEGRMMVVRLIHSPP